MKKLRWGIIGTGKIAHKFATGLQACADAELVAVGSRAQDTADAFGDEFRVPRRHASYEALAADPGVDAVYVSTPHSLHRENAMLCLNAGKAVLCEKPFTINAREAEDVIALARRKKLFLMEGMWVRFLPVQVKLRELIASGAVGEVRMVQSAFGFQAEFDPKHRLFDPALGGGALLDIGVYPVSLASMVLGPAEDVKAFGRLGATGVDELAGAVARHANGRLSVATTSICVTMLGEGLVFGSKGRIRIDEPCWRAEGLTLTLYGGKGDTRFETPMTSNGFCHEADEVARCLRAGKLESDVMPLDETLSLMRTMDEIRAQIGLRYPME